MFLSVSDTGDSEEKFQVHPTEDEPVSFWLLVYHYDWASGGLQVVTQRVHYLFIYLIDVYI